MADKLSYKKSFDVIGKEGVPMYQQSLIKNDRVATGKTKNSIRYTATANKLTFYALDHIRDLETGQTAAQVQAKSNSPDFFQQIDEWVKARSIRANTSNVVRSLIANGWNTTRPNRTGQNGGTKGIITDIDDIIVKQTKEYIAKDSVDQILNSFKVTKR